MVPSVVVPIAGKDVETYREDLTDKINRLIESTGLRPFGHDVLIAVFERKNLRTAGGLYYPDNAKEDRFQGVSGLIIAMEPMASDKSPDFYDWFGGNPPKVGDWIGFSTRDGISFLLGDVSCRLIEYKYLRYSLTRPDLVM
jgi:co-chaperonin GroES (HSP10)